jgi:hypothetical protein
MALQPSQYCATIVFRASTNWPCSSRVVTTSLLAKAGLASESISVRGSVPSRRQSHGPTQPVSRSLQLRKQPKATLPFVHHSRVPMAGFGTGCSPHARQSRVRWYSSVNRAAHLRWLSLRTCLRSHIKTRIPCSLNDGGPRGFCQHGRA